ncbi:MAG: uroporphyrinogen-III synthase [Pseudomonadota bacterium]|nr:uroporphyrinogen-III synthase [Pseudomonadota bacterium]
MCPAAAALQGVGVLVTRPAHQADSLCELIRQQGGTAIRFPVLEIRPPADPKNLIQLIDHIDEYDWAIFISANAVNRALEYILGKRDWPKSVRIAVIGKRSAEELKCFGLAADLFPPHDFNSEALLALAEMQEVGGQRIVIFRGSGGREILADTLRKRDARVEYVEAYRRERPHSDSTGLLRRWRQGLVNIVLVNSAESLRNLVEMLGKDGKSLLTGTPLLVVSERMLALAGELGFQYPPVVADNATDKAVLDALLAWKQAQSDS